MSRGQVEVWRSPDGAAVMAVFASDPPKILSIYVDLTKAEALDLARELTEPASGLLGVRAAARRLGVHENTVRNMAKDGRITVAERLPMSGFMRFHADEVQRVRDMIGEKWKSEYRRKR